MTACRWRIHCTIIKVTEVKIAVDRHGIKKKDIQIKLHSKFSETAENLQSLKVDLSAQGGVFFGAVGDIGMSVLLFIGFQVIEKLTKIILQNKLQTQSLQFSRPVCWQFTSNVVGTLLRDPLGQLFVFRVLVRYIKKKKAP